MKIKFKLPERFQKLIRLANNNPNNNEANTAARRVCKMLQEQNFEFELNVPDAQSGPRTWNDVKRSTEPQWKSTPSQPSPEYQEFRRQEAERSARNQQQWYEDFKNQYTRAPRESNFNQDIFDELLKDVFKNSPYTDASRIKDKKKEKRKLVCKVCKQEKETIFVGAPELFECNDCQWNAYNEKWKGL